MSIPEYYTAPPVLNHTLPSHASQPLLAYPSEIFDTSRELLDIYKYPLASTTFLLVLFLIYRDYKDFLSLGPGGTPSTPAGYARIFVLRLFALHNPLSPPPLHPDIEPQTGYLNASYFPPREGPRPRVKGIAPQRQVTQRSGPILFNLLSREIKGMATCNPRLREGTSCFEKHTAGLFISDPDFIRTRTCNGEVVHAHPSDGSMHVTLHPADAALVLARGWGQRHPLARGGWLSRFVPEGFLMVYAPRTEEEVRTVIRVVRAAAWWVGGERCMDETGRTKEEKVRWETGEEREERAVPLRRPAVLMKTATEHLRAGD